MALKDTEYMYISAKIKAREGQSTYAERIKAYTECNTVDELYALVSSVADLKGNSKREALEAYFENKVSEAFELVRQDAPDPSYFDFLLYEYDACNLKTLIKCMIRGISYDGMTYPYSSASVEELEGALKRRDFTDVLPENMANGALEALDAYNLTKDAGVIDAVIDKACFADMLENSKKSKNALARDIVLLRIDKINIITLQRILKSSLPDKPSMLDSVLLDGGEIPKCNLIRVAQDEGYTLSDALDGTRYKEITFLAKNSESPLDVYEKALEKMYADRIDEEKFVPFGTEVVCLYLVNTLNEAKSARIVIAGLSSSLPKEKIKERVLWTIK